MFPMTSFLAEASPSSWSLVVLLLFATFQRSYSQPGGGGGGGGGPPSSIGRAGALAILIVIIIVLVCCCCGCCFRKRIQAAYENWRNPDTPIENQMQPVAVSQVDMIPTPSATTYGPDGKPIARTGIVYGSDGLPRP